MRLYVWLFYLGVLLTSVFGVLAVMQLSYKYFYSMDELTVDSSRFYVREGDLFDPELTRITNMMDLSEFIDSVANCRSVSPSELPAYSALVDSIIRLRFRYGLQEYGPGENLIAFLFGRFIWSHFSAKVIPDDILKGDVAFCSQSAIVFQEFLKSKGFLVRVVGLKGHFCSEVYLETGWRFHDVSYKPDISFLENKSTSDLVNNLDILKLAYQSSFADRFKNNIEYHFNPDEIFYGAINAYPASKMRFFHRLTNFLSLWGWLVFLIFAIILKQKASTLAFNS